MNRLAILLHDHRVGAIELSTNSETLQPIRFLHVIRVWLSGEYMMTNKEEVLELVAWHRSGLDFAKRNIPITNKFQFAINAYIAYTYDNS